MQKQTPGMCCDLGYTSGTTGPPKAVMHSHDNMVFGANVLTSIGLKETEYISKDNRVLSYLPLSHVAGLSCDVLSPLSIGS
jgi:long-subunit acyl-CoA synthetase (AMP-forming)